MGLYQLIYQSHSLVPFEERELTALLLRLRVYNRERQVTGVLLFTPDGRFLQVLEGDQDAVRALYYQRIVHDPRHHDCRVIGEGPCLQRSFAGWPMGFREAQAQDLRTLLGHVAPDTPALGVPRPPTRPEFMELLRAFLDHCPAGAHQEHPWQFR